MSFSINKEDIASFHKNYRHHPNSSVLENTVTKNGVRNASFNWHSIADNTPHFSIDLKTGDVADQKQSGRCWMFSALKKNSKVIHQKIKITDKFYL